MRRSLTHLSRHRSPTLTLTSLTLASAGGYSVTVTNRYGRAQSQTNYLVVVTPSSYVAAVALDAPKDFWPLDETNAPTAFDYWGGNNGTQNGNVALGVAGPVPPVEAGFDASTTAYGFDGASGYIELGTGPALSGTTDFTLEAWVNTTSAASGVIIQQRYTAGYNGEFEFEVNANGTLYFLLYGGGAYQFSFNSTNTAPLNDGNWHHVAAVRNGSNGYLYADGKLVGAATGAPAPLDPTFTVFIGADMRNYNTYFSGSLSSVAIYTHALSAAQLAHHAVIGISGPPPVLSLVGRSLVWSSGTLLSSPTLGASAVWTPVTGAASPYPLPPTGATGSAMFYRLKQ